MEVDDHSFAYGAVGDVGAGPCTEEVVHAGVESLDEAENSAGNLAVEDHSKGAVASYEADNWLVSLEVGGPPEMEEVKVSSFFPSQ